MDSNTIQVLSALATLAGAVFIWIQIRAAQKTARGEFLLHLDERLDQFREVDECIFDTKWIPEVSRKYGEFTARPNLYDLNRYMGVFERIQTLIEAKIVDFKIFEQLYGRRLRTLVMNDYVHQKLINKAFSWQPFIKLCKALAEMKRRDMDMYIGMWNDIDKQRWIAFIARVDVLPLEHSEWRTNR